MSWTTPEEIRAKVHRKWRTGELLRLWRSGEPFPGFDLPIRGPRAEDLGENLDQARQWARRIEAGSRGGRAYTVGESTVGGRHMGRTTIPGRARIETFEQAWELLGVIEQVREYASLLEVAEDQRYEAALTWARNEPIKALAVAPVWPQVLGAHAWLRENRGSGVYLRQITEPGVDTKFVENHRKVLADILGVRSSAHGFLTDLGFARPPAFVRARLTPGLFGLPQSVSEIQLHPQEFQALAAQSTIRGIPVLVIENEITYLAAPIPLGGVVVWSRGHALDLIGELPWFREQIVSYWGDLDTHGFQMLSRFRAYLPEVESTLMDEETLLTHSDRWVTEPAPTHASLAYLTPAEQAVYERLVSDHYGTRVRLEQERIDWAWVTTALSERS